MQSKKYKIVIQNKTSERAEKQKQKNILKQKANKTKTKSKNHKRKWETKIHFLINQKDTRLAWENNDFHKRQKETNTKKQKQTQTKETHKEQKNNT